MTARRQPRQLIWCRGCEAHLGSLFGHPYRLVFLALDRGYTPGHESSGLTIQKRREEIETTNLFPKDPHMKGTLATLQRLLGTGYGNDIWKHFSLINLAKCSRCSDMKPVPPRLYQNCGPFAGGELQILNPHILVTQGTRARDFVASRKNNWRRSRVAEDLQKEVSGKWSQRPDLLRAIFDEPRYLQTLRIDGSPVVWLHTTHPSAWQRNAWKRFETQYLQAVCEIASALRLRIG